MLPVKTQLISRYFEVLLLNLLVNFVVKAEKIRIENKHMTAMFAAFRVFLPQHHFSTQSSPHFYNPYPILSSIMLQMPKPSQSTMPYHLSHTLNTQNTYIRRFFTFEDAPHRAVPDIRISGRISGIRLVSGIRYPVDFRSGSALLSALPFYIISLTTIYRSPPLS